MQPCLDTLCQNSSIILFHIFLAGPDALKILFTAQIIFLLHCTRFSLIFTKFEFDYLKFDISEKHARRHACCYCENYKFSRCIILPFQCLFRHPVNGCSNKTTLFKFQMSGYLRQILKFLIQARYSYCARQT